MVVDSPLKDADQAEPEAVDLYFVLVNYWSKWHVFSDDDGNWAVFPTLAEAEKKLIEAKRFIHRKSSEQNPAAVGLRIAHSPTEEI